ncbi:lipid II:glycine glycyltransferase FemX [Methanoculleus horonobensis]|uniref:lipid II:glycine glycyltransferase FemX n=1 Tax=Methanoculleus horonobensis TaxID=528314 RepID=UPI0008359B20|nr:GNAT family N-acetyltransferase [Methanoculleus horonobensis]
MISTLSYGLDEVDERAWNQLLSTCKPDIHNIYQTLEWATLLEKVYGYEPGFLLTCNGSKPVAGHLIFRKRVARHLSARESAGGPLSNGSLIYETLQEECDLFLQERRLSVYTRLRPISSPGVDDVFIRKGYVKCPLFTYILRLDKPEEVLWKEIARSARGRVKKAVQNGVCVAEALDWQDWIRFYHLHYKHSRNKGITPKSQQFFEMLYTTLLPRGMVKLFVASLRGHVIGGMLFFIFQGTMTHYISSSSKEDLEHCPSDLIMWHAIQWGAKSGIRYLDLGDTQPDPDSHLYGIHRFKEKWGGELINRSLYVRGKIYVLGYSAVNVSRRSQRVYEFINRHGLL